MKKLIVFILILFSSSLFCCAQDSERKVADNTINLVNDDFRKLDTILKDKRIIILGESGHRDGTTFEYKIKLVKYLVEKHGFTTLGLEGTDLLTSIIYPRIDKNDLAKIMLNPMLYYAIECQDLVQYINNKKIKCFGIDNNYDDRFFSCLKTLPETKDINFKLLEKYNDRTLYSEDDLLKLKKDMTPLTLKDEKQCVDELNKIKYRIELSNKLNPGNDNSNYIASVVMQGLKNAKEYYKGSFYRKGYQKMDFSNDEINEINNRDAQMADNIIWYLDHNPNSKVIIWCANFHGAKDISQVSHDQFPPFYSRLKLMGEFLTEKYQDKLYSIAFTSYNNFGNIAPDKSLEHEIALKKFKIGFIDFTKLRYNKDYFYKNFHTCFINFKKGYWLNVYDGVFFIQTQKISTWRSDFKI